MAVCFYQYIEKEFLNRMIEEKMFSPRQEKEMKQISDIRKANFEFSGIWKEILKVCKENWSRKTN